MYEISCTRLNLLFCVSVRLTRVQIAASFSFYSYIVALKQLAGVAERCLPNFTWLYQLYSKPTNCQYVGAWLMSFILAVSFPFWSQETRLSCAMCHGGTFVGLWVNDLHYVKTIYVLSIYHVGMYSSCVNQCLSRSTLINWYSAFYVFINRHLLTYIVGIINWIFSVYLDHNLSSISEKYVKDNEVKACFNAFSW